MFLAQMKMTAVAIAAVRDRAAAIKAIHRIFSELGLLSFCEIAYFDQAEHFWRTVHPLSAGPFDRLVKIEDLEAAVKEDLEREVLYREFVRLFEPKKKPGENE
jgi:hypothetical protein